MIVLDARLLNAPPPASLAEGECAVTLAPGAVYLSAPPGCYLVESDDQVDWTPIAADGALSKRYVSWRTR